MKKFFFTMVTLLTMAVSSNAMSYEQARQQALFLADKMAYELNLTEDQYEACYEINLDYLLRVTNRNDVYGLYWERRNLDLSYILMDWQYRLFCDAAYFFRPLTWYNGLWHFTIYTRYPHRDYFYFGRPHFYHTYRGGHSWHMNNNHSWYHGRTWGTNNHSNGHKNNGGMRDGFNKGNYGRGGNLDLNNDRGHNNSERHQERGNSSTRDHGNGNARTDNNGGGFHIGGSNYNHNDGHNMGGNITNRSENGGNRGGFSIGSGERKFERTDVNSTRTRVDNSSALRSSGNTTRYKMSDTKVSTERKSASYNGAGSSATRSSSVSTRSSSSSSRGSSFSSGSSSRGSSHSGSSSSRGGSFGGGRR